MKNRTCQEEVTHEPRRLIEGSVDEYGSSTVNTRMDIEHSNWLKQPYERD
jgi:hypothetical protein